MQRSVEPFGERKQQLLHSRHVGMWYEDESHKKTVHNLNSLNIITIIKMIILQNRVIVHRIRAAMCVHCLSYNTCHASYYIH